MNTVKVFIAMIAVALGGLIIWSCTQDEMESGQATYDTGYGKSGETTSTRWISKDRIGISYSCNVSIYEIKRTQFGEEIKTELASDYVTVDTSTAI